MVWKKAGTSCPVPVLVSESTAAMEEDVWTLKGVGQKVPVMGIRAMPLKVKPLNCGCMKSYLLSSCLLHLPYFFPEDLLCDASTGKW